MSHFCRAVGKPVLIVRSLQDNWSEELWPRAQERDRQQMND